MNVEDDRGAGGDSTWAVQDAGYAVPVPTQCDRQLNGNIFVAVQIDWSASQGSPEAAKRRRIQSVEVRNCAQCCMQPRRNLVVCGFRQRGPRR